MATDTPRIAWVAGASGLTGRLLLDALLEAPEYSRVLAISRRAIGREHARLANRIVPFDQLEAQLAGQGCTDAFCCLGTTMASAGSEAAFRAVDCGEVLRFARAARKAGATRFVVMSSVGADPQSKNFYLRVKGEMETQLEALGFAALDIVQPGLLLGGQRGETRAAESLGRVLMPLANPLMQGALKRYRGIDAAVLARAMVGIARSGRRGVHRYTWEALQRAALRKKAQ
jgi:uncharacterized protein YbjT (DUF2867 family)